MSSDLDNVKAWRGWFRTTIRHPWWTFTWPVGIGWVTETEDPFRHGRGIAVRTWPTRTVIVGRWWPTSAERPGYRTSDKPKVPRNSWEYVEDPFLDVDDFETPTGVLSW